MRPRSGSTKTSPLTILFGCAVGLVLGLIMVRADGPSLRPHRTGDIVAVPVLILAIFIAQIVMHEVGHYVAGTIARFDLVRFYIKPLLITKSGRNLKLSWDFGHRVLGFVQMYPRDQDNLVGRYRFLLLGGVAANAAIGLVAAGLIFVPAADSWHPRLWAIISVLFVVLNLAPNRAKGFQNDGKQIWNLRKQDPGAQRNMAMMMLNRDLFGGKRSRDWDPVWMSLLPGPADGSLQELVALVYRGSFLKDGGRLQEYGTVELRIRELLKDRELSDSLVGQSAKAICALNSAWPSGDVEEAQRFLDQIPARIFGLHATKKLVEAAIACRREQFSGARILGDEAEALLREQNRETGVSVEETMEILAQIRQDCDRLQVASLRPVIPL